MQKSTPVSLLILLAIISDLGLYRIFVLGAHALLNAIQMDKNVCSFGITFCTFMIHITSSSLLEGCSYIQQQTSDTRYITRAFPRELQPESIFNYVRFTQHGT